MNLLARLLRLLPVRMLVLVLRALPQERVRRALARLIARYEAEGTDVLAEVVEAMLRDPKQRDAAMNLAVRVLLAPPPIWRPLLVDRPASWSMRIAFERVFRTRPALRRDVVREGLAGQHSEAWRRIGGRFGVRLEEQEQFACSNQAQSRRHG